MTEREIVLIDEEKCIGCGDCVPNCHEGALQMIDDKARLISDLFCDGLGACIGHCPVGAISIEKREAEPYDEYKVMEMMVPKGENTIKAHLLHLKDHGAMDLFQQGVDYLIKNEIPIPAGLAEHKMPVQGGCPGSAVRSLDASAGEPEGMSLARGCPGTQVKRLEGEDDCDDGPIQDLPGKEAGPMTPRQSQLRTWPIQLKLVPPHAPYLREADIVIAADCVPFAYPDFHEDFLKDRVLLIGCPKLDDPNYYVEKIAEIIKTNSPRSITTVHMEVPCCFGMTRIVEAAVKDSGVDVPVEDITIGVKGDIVQ